jgi:hypothetical protein
MLVGVRSNAVREKSMKIHRFAGVVAFASLMALAFSEPAKAITATLLEDDIITVPGTSLGPQAPNFQLPGTHVDLITPPPDSEPGQFRSPWQGTGLEGSLGYTSVKNGTAGYNLTGTLLTLFWGSPDTYNTLTFWTGLNGTGDSASILGSDLSNPQAIGHHLVLILTNEVFRSVTISSTSPAFEYANFAVTPIPAALPLFATGLGLMGWLARRRKRGHAVPITA